MVETLLLNVQQDLVETTCFTGRFVGSTGDEDVMVKTWMGWILGSLTAYCLLVIIINRVIDVGRMIVKTDFLSISAYPTR